MKYLKMFLLLTTLVATATVSASGFARGGSGRGGGYGGHGGHGNQGHHFSHRATIGVFVGPAFYSPYYYYPPNYYPYYPAVTNVPPVYVEQGSAGPVLSPGYWYYCGPAGAYYPNVNECPGGWQQVSPQP
jgi:hypothetical protein